MGGFPVAREGLRNAATGGSGFWDAKELHILGQLLTPNTYIGLQSTRGAAEGLAPCRVAASMRLRAMAA